MISRKDRKADPRSFDTVQSSKQILDLLQRHPSRHHHESRRLVIMLATVRSEAVVAVTSPRLDPMVVRPTLRDGRTTNSYWPIREQNTSPFLDTPMSNALLYLSHPIHPPRSPAAISSARIGGWAVGWVVITSPEPPCSLPNCLMGPGLFCASIQIKSCQS